MTLKPKSGYKIVKRSFGKCEEIPEMWELDKIQNHVKITTGSRNTQDKIETGKYPFFVRSKNIEKINSYSYDGEAVLTVGDGRIGEIFHYVNGKFDFHQRVYKISNFDQLLDGYFFYLYFSTFFLHRAKSMTAKNTVDSVRMNMITEMLIPLPPILEQQKIASILSEVDALIESTQKVIEKTKRLKKGMMQKLLTRGIDYKKFKKVKGLLGKEIEIPEEWRVVKIKDIGSSSAGGTPSRSNISYWKNGTIPWLSSGEIRNNLILTSHEKITELGLKESATKIFPKGSIMLAITGQGKTRGRTGLLGIDSSTNQSVVGIETYDDVSNIYFWCYLQNQYNKLRSISQGSNQSGLNLKLIHNYKVFLPPLTEQQKIASILSGVDARRHRNIIALIILRIKLAIFLILFVGISVNACKNILVAVQVTDRPLCETVLRTL